MQHTAPINTSNTLQLEDLCSKWNKNTNFVLAMLQTFINKFEKNNNNKNDDKNDGMSPNQGDRVLSHKIHIGMC